MLDQAGHAHLMDFNVAVKFKEGKPLKAVAGSLAYMAPEILLKKGYYASVDYWSLGVLLFECLYKKRPFKAKLSEQLSQAIKADPIEFINFFADQDPISQNCTQFLSQVMVKYVSHFLELLD